MISKFIGKLILFSENAKDHYIAVYQKSSFASCGNKVHVSHKCRMIPSHIYCGNNVHIGQYAEFIASIAYIHIADNVVIGPHVTIRGGDHRIDLVGKHIINIMDSEKLPENDADVYIEEGAWIGCNVTILKGVTIGKGAVVAAGSVVTKSIPAYSIAGGVPAKVLRMRFTPEEIIEHERILGLKNSV